MNKKFFTLIVITAVLAVTATDAFSQVEGKFRVGLNPGISIATFRSYPLFFGDITFGYNPRDNMNIGAKVGFGYLYFQENKSSNYSINSNVTNFLGTYTYYFGSKSIMPFVGVGLGVYAFRNNYYSKFYTNSEDYYEIGALLTTGIEFGRFRLAIEFNMAPALKGTFQEQGTTTYLNIKNSFPCVTAGFYLGGGNRKKVERERERIAALERAERAEVAAAEQERIAGIFSLFAQDYIEPRMTAWQQRGDFETTANYQQRVNEMTRIAKSTELYREAEQEFIALRSGNFAVGNMTFSAYDPDNETVRITNSIHGIWVMNVPTGDAPHFINNWSSFVRLPQFGIRNDRLALIGMNFVSTDGKIYRFSKQSDSGNFTLAEISNIAEIQQPVPVVAQQGAQPEVPPVANVQNIHAATATNADIITMRNGDEIKAKVVEITLSEIKYKQFEYLDGPTRTVSKNDVFAINYENGTREVFNTFTQNTRNTGTSTNTRSTDTNTRSRNSDILSVQQGDRTLGGNLNIIPGFGIGVRFSYNVIDPVRLSGEFVYNTLFLANFWDLSIYGNYLFFAGRRVAIYPLAGIGMINGNVLGLVSIKGLAITVGGGIDIALTPRLIIYNEYRYKILPDYGNISNYAFLGLARKF